MVDDNDLDEPMNIEQRTIASLTPDPENARRHSAKNLDAIKNSLERFGQVKPLVITGNGIVLAGNGTLEAAKALGWTDIAVTVAPPWDYATARAYALADNRTSDLSEWDQDTLVNQLIELDSEGWEVGDLGFVDLQPPSDPEPAPILEPRTHTCQVCGEVMACR
jgi:ParB-like chromosome segregation protein Spo0J